MTRLDALKDRFRPNRLIARPPDPDPDLLAGVGLGDFWTVGADQVELIAALAGLEPHDRVLEIGCGLGRIAWPLSERLGRRGRYAGIDTSWPYVNWCNENLGLNPARFWFHYLDVFNSTYNPTGSIPGREATFPYKNRSFDLVLAISLFTHVDPATLDRYLAEAVRVMRPAGRMFASFFVIDQHAEDQIEEDKAGFRFEGTFEHGLLADPSNPDLGVGFFDGWLRGAFDRAGLRIDALRRGAWIGGDERFFQDVIVARRR